MPAKSGHFFFFFGAPVLLGGYTHRLFKGFKKMRAVVKSGLRRNIGNCFVGFKKQLLCKVYAAKVYI